jgi:amidase
MAPERIWNAWLVWRHVLTASRLAPLVEQPGARAHIKPEALWEYDGARGCTAGQLIHASAVRSAFHEALLRLFEQHDVLVLPTAQTWPFGARERWPKAVAGRAMDTYHRWMEVVIYATFAGLPALSVPAGFNAAGLPMGMQLIGAPRQEAAVLRLGATYETLIADWLSVRPAALEAAGTN